MTTGVHRREGIDQSLTTTRASGKHQITLALNRRELLKTTASAATVVGTTLALNPSGAAAAAASTGRTNEVAAAYIVLRLDIHTDHQTTMIRFTTC